jgi:O-antigen/teichoic acid export membrane protein
MLEELKKLAKHTTIYGLGNILNKAVGFFMIPFYTHYLTPADYGTLELLELTSMVVGLILNVWVLDALIRYYYEYDDEKDKNEVISTAMISIIAMAGFAVVAGITYAKELSQLILKSPDFHPYIWLIFITFFFSCLHSVSWNYLRAKQRSVRIVCLDFISLTLALSLNIYFIAFLKIGMIGVLYSSIVSTSFIATIMTINTIREVKLSFSLRKLKALAAFGSPLIFTSAAAFILNFADRFFLQHFSSVADVGVYALGYKFGFMLSYLIVQPFLTIWAARMYEIAKREGAGEVFSRIFIYFSLGLLIATLSLSVMIKELITVIAAPDFHQAYRIVPFIAMSYAFHGIACYFQTGIYLRKRTGYIAVIGCASAGSNLLLNYLLIPPFGAMGAAWATTLSFLIMTILAYGFAQRVYPIPYRLSKLLMVLALGTLFYLASTLISVSSLVLGTALKLPLIAGLPLALYWLGFFDQNEVAKIKNTASIFFARYCRGSAILLGR